MSNSKAASLPPILKTLLAEKSRVLSQAQTFATLGMMETAQPLWLSAAAAEERIAPLMESIGRAAEAALHRISAASCYAKAGHLSQAVNYYRAALAGPMPDHTRQDIETLLLSYLAELDERLWRSGAVTIT